MGSSLLLHSFCPECPVLALAGVTSSGKVTTRSPDREAHMATLSRSFPHVATLQGLAAPRRRLDLLIRTQATLHRFQSVVNHLLLLPESPLFPVHYVAPGQPNRPWETGKALSESPVAHQWYKVLEGAVRRVKQGVNLNPISDEFA